METIQNIRKKYNIFLFIGLLAPLRMPYLPLISPLEIIASIFFLQSLFKSNLQKSNLFKTKVYKSFRLLFFIWIASQSISNILNGVSLINSLRGIGIPVLIFFTLNFILEVYDRNQRDPRFITYYFFGHSISFTLLSIANFLRNGDFFYSVKWGILIYLTIIAFILFPKRLSRIITSLTMLLLSIIFQVRSNTLVFLIYLVSNFNIFQKKIKYKIKDLNIMKVIFGGILNFFFVILLLFSSGPLYSLITSGIINLSINPDRSQIIVKQKKSFFDTRLEYYSYFQQFKDAPLFGHGSWSVDDDLKYIFIKERNNPFNQNRTDFEIMRNVDEIARITNKIDNILIPGHSLLMQSITWGGILSGLFFFYLLNLNFAMIIDRSLNSVSRLFVALNIFNIFFSPMGNNRFTLPIICFLAIVHFAEQSKKNN